MPQRVLSPPTLERKEFKPPSGKIPEYAPGGGWGGQLYLLTKEVHQRRYP